MRTLIPGVCWLVLSIAMAAHTPKAEPQRPPAQDGGTREVLESIVIPPIPNQRFTATLQTEWIRYTGEGGSITLVNERPLARDRKGRIDQERWLLVPKYGKIKSQMNWIQIANPNQHTLYSCNPFRRICELETYDPNSELASGRTAKTRSEWRGGNRSPNHGRPGQQTNCRRRYCWSPRNDDD